LHAARKAGKGASHSAPRFAGNCRAPLPTRPELPFDSEGKIAGADPQDISAAASDFAHPSRHISIATTPSIYFVSSLCNISHKT
jgi:hypothetical protein